MWHDVPPEIASVRVSVEHRDRCRVETSRASEEFAPESILRGGMERVGWGGVVQPRGRRREAMNAARRKGTPRIDARTTMSGQRPTISPLRSIMTVTWLGTMRPVQVPLPASGEVARSRPPQPGPPAAPPTREARCPRLPAGRRWPRPRARGQQAVATRGNDGVTSRAHVYQRVPPYERRGCAPGNGVAHSLQPRTRGRSAEPPARVSWQADTRDGSVAAELEDS